MEDIRLLLQKLCLYIIEVFIPRPLMLIIALLPLLPYIKLLAGIFNWIHGSSPNPSREIKQILYTIKKKIKN